MVVTEFVASVPRFHSLSKVDQILALCWFLHEHDGVEEISPTKLRDAFRAAGVEPPDLSVYLPRLAGKKPPQIIQKGSSVRLEARERQRLDARLGGHPTTVAVTKLLVELPGRVPNIQERAFLSEALSCYRVGAFRAAIVMAWNLAFDHLRLWLLADQTRLASFNSAIKARYPKSAASIGGIDDFDDLKESEVVEVLKTSGLVSDNVVGILREKLSRRNRAAHPSSVVVTQHQADDAVTDLVNNVVLALT